MKISEGDGCEQRSVYSLKVKEEGVDVENKEGGGLANAKVKLKPTNNSKKKIKRIDYRCMHRYRYRYRERNRRYLERETVHLYTVELSRN
ncbi:hypothetical protein L1987_24855 [Smallanthus sonchifolius]|uniref:Uncharacterized protein n=1 Tax=Smallanthus sonchifolius TaxID=185202 RepID=A0ACB9IM73_9ASTR|nr:hypothetical protein L1987_24855 [Smallanthus sonchifolius]